MGLREVINRNPAIGAGIGIVAIGIAAAVIFGTSGSRVENQGWFLDLESGAIFQADRFAIPPIAAPSGSLTGVRAVVLGCGSCPDAPTKAHWLEKLSPEASALQDKLDEYAKDTSDQPPTLTAAEQQTYDNGHLMAEPSSSGKPPRWFPAESEEGRAAKDRIISSACTGGKPTICVPGQ